MTSFAWILLLQLLVPSEASIPSAAHHVAAPEDGKKPPQEKPEQKPEQKPAPKPAPPKQPPLPTKPAPPKDGPTCSLPEEEGPRGGRLVIEGARFGRTPLVRIGDQVTRILVRKAKAISVQIPRNSNGGPVTVEVEGVRAACGWLTIVGKDR